MDFGFVSYRGSHPRWNIWDPGDGGLLPGLMIEHLWKCFGGYSYLSQEVFGCQFHGVPVNLLGGTGV